MAHKLKYYKEIESHGHLWRVEILQETEDTLTPTEIGPVLQGLRLVMQGDQADVDTPIVKTSLEMTFVDAPDLEEERKCGYWEEFYTSSATEYRVRLMKDGAVEWTGYVTPDSFSEDLRHRGSVSIIARDNLGLLQDFDYNIISGQIEGMVSLRAIIDEAQAVSSFAMSISHISSQQNLMPICKDYDQSQNYVLDSIFCNKALREMNMWEALESALYSCGLIMRYIGRNSYVIQSIRSLGIANNALWMDAERKEVRFCAYGHRELSPAVKKVADDVQFDIAEELIDTYTPAQAYGDEIEIKYTERGETYTIPVHAVGSGRYECTTANTFLLNAFKYSLNATKKYGTGGDIHDENIVYLASNIHANSSYIDSHSIDIVMPIPAGKYKISMEMNKVISLYDNKETVGYLEPSWVRLSFEAKYYGEDGSVKCLLKQTDSPDAKWVDGDMLTYYGFQTEGGLPVTIDSPVPDAPVAGTIQITIDAGTADIGIAVDRAEDGHYGAYLGIKNLTIKTVDNGGRPIMQGLKLSTVYKDTNNIALNRSPKFAPNPSALITPLQVSNGIYGKAGNVIKGSDRWVFHEDDIPVPLTVLIHQQILAYYAKPNNVLTGELVLEDDVPDFRSLWRWGGKDHLLMSGTLNVLTGRMESAVLCEFTRYDHMWDTWIEKEDIKVDYSNSRIEVIVHSNRKLSLDSISGLPSWVTPASIIIAGNYKHRYTLNVMENVSGQERSAIFRIDTAYMRVTQSAAGDYNIDYGTDYS